MIRYINDLYPLCAMVQPSAQLLHLELEIDQASQDELHLMAGKIPGGRLEPHRQQRPRPIQDVGGDVRRPDLRPGRQDHHRFDEVAELTHVARPGRIYQSLHSLRGNAPEGPVMLLRQRPNESPHEQRDVFPALSQRREVDVEDVEAVVEIVPELTEGDGSRKERLVAASTRTSTWMGLTSTHPEERPALEHAKELDLRRRRDLADLVEEDRARVGQLEPAEPPLRRAGERALLVAEQLLLEQRVGERGAVDGDEGLAAPGREIVHRLGDELLAGAALTLMRTVLETGAICSILTSTSWIAALSPMMPVRCCSPRRSMSRRAVATASSGATGFIIVSVTPSRPTRSARSESVGSSRASVEISASRASLASCSACGSCTAPVRITSSGLSRRTVPARHRAGRTSRWNSPRPRTPR